MMRALLEEMRGMPVAGADALGTAAEGCEVRGISSAARQGASV